MIMPTSDETLSAVRVAHNVSRLPDSASTLPLTMAVAAATEPNSSSNSAKTPSSEAPSAVASSANARCWLA